MSVLVESKGRMRPGLVVLQVICILVCVVMLTPLLMSFFASVKAPGESNLSPPNYLPQVWSIANYAKIFTYQAGLGVYVWNSLSTALLSRATASERRLERRKRSSTIWRVGREQNDR